MSTPTSYYDTTEDMRDTYVRNTYGGTPRQPSVTNISNIDGNEQRKRYWETVLNAHSDSSCTIPPPISEQIRNGTHAASSSSAVPLTGASQRSGKRKNYHCNTCNTGYVQKGDYVRHIRTRHEGIRPFTCQTCGEKFARRSILNKHVKTHVKKNRNGVHKSSGCH